MKLALAFIAAFVVSTAFGFFVALFLQALGKMSQAENDRLADVPDADPWHEIVHPHDKWNDDHNTK